MKVAFIHHAFPRVHNTFTVNEIVELLRQGVDVKIFSLSRPPDILRNDNIQRYGIDRRTVYVEDLPQRDLRVPASCEPFMRRFRRPAESRLRRLVTGRWFQVPPPRFSFGAIAEQLVGEGFDIIHGTFGNTPATAAMILSHMTGIPWTFETHAYDLFVDFPFADAKLSSAARVFTESRYHRTYLETQLKAPPEKVEILHLSPDRVMLEDLGDVVPNDNIVITVSRLHPIKGLTYALQAIAKLRDAFPMVEYHVIGQGPLDDVLRAEAQRLDIQANVRFLGAMRNEDACRLVRGAAVFLLPSVIAPDGDRDGTPTAIAEAMQLEVPIVSSRVSGIPELVDDGVSGFLTAPGDVDAIAEALRTLLGDRQRRLTMGRAGRRKVLAEFNVETNTRRLIAAWTDIVQPVPH